MESPSVRLLDLSKVEREVFQENCGTIRKLFLVKSTQSVNSEEDEFRGEVRTFLESYIAIFLKISKKSFPRLDLNKNCEDDQNENKVASFPSAKEKCITKFRSVYRKYFRVFAYLTSDKLQTCHSEAVYEGLKKWMELSSKSCQTIQLEESMEQEGKWIREVNSWKREKLLEQIKCDVLENIKNELGLELPFLFGDCGEYFYEKGKFAEKCREVRKRAVQRFIEEVTLILRDEPETLEEQVAEFRKKDVKRKLICYLAFRNTLGKFRYYWKLMKSVDDAVKEYGERIDSFLHPTSVYAQNVIEMNPNLIFKESEILKQDMLPKSILLRENERVKDLEKIDMRIRHLKKYYTEIESKFGEVVRNAALIAEANLIRCEIDTEEVLGRMMAKLKDYFGEYNLSKEHVDRWQERVEGELLMVIRKKKKFSIANPKHVDRLLLESQHSTGEALQRINADIIELRSPISSSAIAVAEDEKRGVKIIGRFGNFPWPIQMSSGATDFIDEGSSCWKLDSLLPTMMESSTSYLISLLHLMSPPSIFPGHSFTRNRIAKIF